MDYKVMKRPMFRVGGPTSGGTGITSGLEEPRQNYRHGTTYKDYLQDIPGAFKKRREGLENQMGSIGPMAAYSAAASGALNDVNSIGDLAMAFGNPAVLQSVVGGMGAKNKIQSSLDDVDLKEATTMATLLKPKDTKDTDYDKKIRRIRSLTIETRNLNQINKDLEASKEGKNDLEIAKIDQIIKKNNDEIEILNKEEKLIISRTLSRQEVKEAFEKDYEAKKGFSPSAKKIDEHMQSKGFYSDGGRINKQMGGGFDTTPESQAVSQETQMQPQGEDPFMILRKRLPPEITDDVVSLIAYNKAAFTDFANIQDQDDVDLFNQKYNVQLVVDMASA